MDAGLPITIVNGIDNCPQDWSIQPPPSVKKRWAAVRPDLHPGALWFIMLIQTLQPLLFQQ